MNWLSLERVYRAAGRTSKLRVRFNDWTHTVKYFTILKESRDGERFIGLLDSGERMAFFKKQKGWSIYSPGDEFSAHAV